MSAPAAAVPSVRAFAFDGDAEYVVHRAEHPPTRADALFRADARPLATRLAYLIDRAATDPAGLGGELRDAVTALGDLALSYDVQPVAAICRTRAEATAAGDPRAMAVVARVARGLLGESAPNAVRTEMPNAERPTRAGRSQPDVPPAGSAPPARAAASSAAGPDVDRPGDRPGAFRPPTGPALVALLADGISGLERWPGTPLDTPVVPAPAAPDGVVSIATLCYAGAGALARAREVRDALRAGGSPPDPALLDELYDLIDLAAN